MPNGITQQQEDALARLIRDMLDRSDQEPFKSLIAETRLFLERSVELKDPKEPDGPWKLKIGFAAALNNFLRAFSVGAHSAITDKRLMIADLSTLTNWMANALPPEPVAEEERPGTDHGTIAAVIVATTG